MNETVRGAVMGAMAVVIAVAIAMQWPDDPAHASAAADRDPSVVPEDPAETLLPPLPPPSAPPADGAERLARLREPVVVAPAVVVVTESRAESAPRGTGVRRRVARGDDAIAVTTPLAPGDEWWFTRNPVDPHQFEAVQIVSRERVLLLHGCSDLIERGIARSFGELVQLGVSAVELASLHADGATEEAFGLRFERRVAAAGSRGSLREVWWNDEWKLPLRSVRSREVTEIIELQPGVAASELADPRSRHPDFAVWENVDWLEKLEDHEPVAAGGHAGQAGHERHDGHARGEPPRATRTELTAERPVTTETAPELPADPDAALDATNAVETALPELPPPGRVRTAAEQLEEERELARRAAERAGSPFPESSRAEPDD